MGLSQAQIERAADKQRKSVGGDLHAKCFQGYNSMHSAELSENINSKQFIATLLHHMIVYPFTLTVGFK